jgi:outer membrane protein assembly factor BamB
MRKRDLVVAILAGGAMLPAADWLTDGGNQYRNGWQKDEKILTKANVSGMKALWNIKLENEVRELHALFPPLIIGALNVSGTTREVAIVTGITDTIFAIDVAKGEILWKKKWDSTYTPPPGGRGGGPLCPGGQTATPTIGPGGAPGKYTIYAISWDGRLRQLNAADGETLAQPLPFVPANGKPYSLNLVKNILYTTTAQGCGGNPNRIYTMDMSDPAHKVNSWATSGGSWGRSGAAVDDEGVAYAPTGDGNFDPPKNQWAEALVAVRKDGTLKDYYAPSNALWLWKMDLDMQVTPTLFDYKGRKLLATSSKECRIFLLDRNNLGGADHRTPLVRTTWMCNEEVNFAAAGVWGSLATWEDAKGTRWLLSPIWGPSHPDFKPAVTHGPVTHGAIVAWKVEEVNGKITMTPAWMSRDMDQAEPPVIANGVIYAYGNGESSAQASPEMGLGANQSSIRIKNSTHAVLYALDAETGKELWNSGDEIKSFGHFTGLSIANGRVYLGTFDNVLYSFGLPGGAR